MNKKRRALSTGCVIEKIDILRKYDENTTLKQFELENALGIPNSTLRTNCFKKEKKKLKGTLRIPMGRENDCTWTSMTN